MKNLQPNPPTVPDDQLPAACFVCQKPIVDNQWFCRVPEPKGATGLEPKCILLCSPGCAYRYFAFGDIGMAQI